VTIRTDITVLTGTMNNDVDVSSGSVVWFGDVADDIIDGFLWSILIFILFLFLLLFFFLSFTVQ
jgi:hypothetical protein